MGVVDKEPPGRRGNLKKAKECLPVGLKESHGIGLPKANQEPHGKKQRVEEGRREKAAHKVVGRPLILAAAPCP